MDDILEPVTNNKNLVGALTENNQKSTRCAPRPTRHMQGSSCSVLVAPLPPVVVSVPLFLISEGVQIKLRSPSRFDSNSFLTASLPLGKIFK